MHISQVFVLSSRGDKIIFKDYRNDAPCNADEIFFRKYNFWDGAQHQAPKGECPPFFTEKGVNFGFVKRYKLFFVCTSMVNVSPSLTMEILLRIVGVIRDYLGVLSEESIRKNFALVYELLDEMLDFGVPQELNSERLRPYIFNDVELISKQEGANDDSFLERLRRGDLMGKTRQNNAALSSIVRTSGERRNEIFVDIVERLNVVFNSAGQVVVACVDGSVIMKSFLIGSPTMYVTLNEDLTVRQGDASRAQYASVVLDSVNFHEEVDSSRFASMSELSLCPQDGELTLMNYRLTTGDAQPFRLTQSLELLSPQRALLVLRVRADIPTSTHGVSVGVKVPLPVSCTGATAEFAADAFGQTYDYSEEEKCLVWSIAKFAGGTEQICNIRFSTLKDITALTRRSIGPVSMTFEIPYYNMTGLCIKSLRLEERSSSYNPKRWIRNMTLANSYVFRTV